MPSTLFDLECDRLVRLADPANYERKRWQRQEGAVLTSLLGRIREAFSHRPEFVVQEIESEERNVVLSVGSSDDCEPYFVLQLEIEGANLFIRTSSGSDYSFTYEQVHSAPVHDLSDEWLDKVLRATLANVQRREDPETIELEDDESVESPVGTAGAVDESRTDPDSETKSEFERGESTSPEKLG